MTTLADSTDFSKAHRRQRTYKACPPELIAKYRGRLPDVLVNLAVPLTLFASVWGAIRLLRWARAHRAHAGEAAADILISDSLGGFRGWLGDRFDSYAETGGGDSLSAGDGSGDCGEGGDSGGGGSD